MGRDFYVHDIPFLLWDEGRKGTPNDGRLDANGEDPDGWEEVNGWAVQGIGQRDTEWHKGDHAVEVVHACEITRTRVYYAADDRASLEAWKRDHGLPGEILVGERVVHEG